WNIARSAHFKPGSGAPTSGAVLDGYGGLHSDGSLITISTTAYWGGWDIARDFAFLPDGTGGFVLDGWGGLHSFRGNGNTASRQGCGCCRGRPRRATRWTGGEGCTHSAERRR